METNEALEEFKRIGWDGMECVKISDRKYNALLVQLEAEKQDIGN